MIRARLVLVAFVAASLLTPVSVAAGCPTPDVYFVPDVVGQSNALSLRSEPFGDAGLGTSEPSDNIDKHI